jgi:uroporphyrin-III C-methyltransferase/precorrin-2 dehydrogenase/sirohydrochlorin ferrochelatase
LVVRLKGGDPFVFGRGGEEAAALEAAGVPYDVVPGVTSAVAAPELAGIPLTHRGLSSAVLVASGHERDAFAAAIGELQANAVTVVVMMGYERRRALAAVLLERGWQAATPAAVVANGSLPSQQVWRGTLADLAAGGGTVANGGPAMIVVGAVAALALKGGLQEDAGDVTSPARGTRHVI